MRGTPNLIAWCAVCAGIIPAHAGNTSPPAIDLAKYGDHPRACGEHAVWFEFRAKREGSSPRMRGTLNTVTTRHSHTGIIPAHAGNTSSTGGWRKRARDHPRACGEHICNNPCLAKLRGSSPRMRGTLGAFARPKQNRGIIPAHAGNTLFFYKDIKIIWDHPRACGEHGAAFDNLDAQRGSSPRMRGTLVISDVDSLPLGIIPAHAGNTDSQAWRLFLRGDHPRACGEHRSESGTKTLGLGSSPRMRGTPEPRSRIRMARRIIPAHAGNTGRRR